MQKSQNTRKLTLGYSTVSRLILVVKKQHQILSMSNCENIPEVFKRYFNYTFNKNSYL